MKLNGRSWGDNKKALQNYRTNQLKRRWKYSIIISLIKFNRKSDKNMRWMTMRVIASQSKHFSSPLSTPDIASSTPPPRKTNLLENPPHTCQLSVNITRNKSLGSFTHSEIIDKYLWYNFIFAQPFRLILILTSTTHQQRRTDNTHDCRRA